MNGFSESKLDLRGALGANHLTGIKKNDKRLTYERVRELFDYDPETGKLTNKTSRGRAKIGAESGSFDGLGYRQILVDYKQFMVHRVIWLWWYGYTPENYIDHVNGEKADNRIENLREVSHSCNLRNAPQYKSNTSGVKGVCFDTSRKKWLASINLNGRNLSVGRFTSFIEAVCHRYAAEQCINWEVCEGNSSAKKELMKVGILKK